MLVNMGGQAKEGTLTSDTLCKTLVSYSLNKLAFGEFEDGTKRKKKKSDSSVIFLYYYACTFSICIYCKIAKNNTTLY